MVAYFTILIRITVLSQQAHFFHANVTAMQVWAHVPIIYVFKFKNKLYISWF